MPIIKFFKDQTLNLNFFSTQCTLLVIFTSAMPSHLLLVFKMRNALVFMSRRLIVSSMKRLSCLNALSVGSPDKVSEKYAATGPLVLKPYV